MLSKKVHVLVFYPLLNWKMHGETIKFIPSCFMWRRFYSSLCAICIQHAWRWKDRHENLININLRLQNFPSASHSMLQVVRCFLRSMVHKITPHDRVLSQINPFHILRTHIFKTRFKIILHLRFGLEMVPSLKVFRPFVCVNVSLPNITSVPSI